MSHILCEISTKDRYYSTLPLTIMSIALQTRPPDELVIFDDGEQKDLRDIPTYLYLFKLLDEKRIKWQIVFGQRKGQHHNHQKAQEMATDLVWRIDDDEIAEPNVLEELEKQMIEGIGAVGGLVLDPQNSYLGVSTGLIKNINVEANSQWIKGRKPQFVEHLYSSFLYRKGVANYDLRLSPVAHREETMFTHEIFKKGFKLVVTDCITWHFRNPEGGIRKDSRPSDWDHDEEIFNTWLGVTEKLIVLDSGLGDHIIFKKILPEVKAKYGEVTIACCFPDVFEGEKTISIHEATKLTDLTNHHIYKWCIDHNWKGEMVDAYRGLYL